MTIRDDVCAGEICFYFENDDRAYVNVKQINDLEATYCRQVPLREGGSPLTATSTSAPPTRTSARATRSALTPTAHAASPVAPPSCLLTRKGTLALSQQQQQQQQQPPFSTGPAHTVLAVT